MRASDFVTWTTDEAQDFANDIKDLVLSKVGVDPLKYVVVAVPRGWFGRLVDKALGKETGTRYVIIELKEPLIQKEDKA